jgi:methionine synthase II (cobalamin-independent)
LPETADYVRRVQSQEIISDIIWGKGFPMAEFKGNALPLLIGSLPIADHDEAVDLVMKYTPDIPLWVQLPRHPEEGMMTQFLSGIPGLVYDADRVLIDTSKPAFEDDILQFYQDYLAVADGGSPLDGTRFVLTPETARGFFTLLGVIESAPQPPVALKGQITGPVTLATGLTDQNKRALFYDDRLLDLVVKTLAMKARWQVENLSKWGLPVIIFIDEPGLAGFGTSAFISISREDVARVLSEVIDAIRQAKGLAGVHVCANTDWSLILDSSADILSFDAYGFFERVVLYETSLKTFFEQDKILAWGIVPTSDVRDIEKETAASLVAKWESQAGRIEALGIERSKLVAQSLITPSCGTGSLGPDQAIRVLEMTREVSETLRSQS